jgi:alkylation response protein AidB-like acyl-CoA dehydrogenase
MKTRSVRTESGYVLNGVKRWITNAGVSKYYTVIAVDDVTFFSSACKCLASDVAMSVTTDAVQLLGGYGYVNDYRSSG